MPYSMDSTESSTLGEVMPRLVSKFPRNLTPVSVSQMEELGSWTFFLVYA